MSKKYKKKKKYFLVECENEACGMIFEILKHTYETRKYYKRPILCFDCMKKYKSDELSKSQLKRYEDPKEHEKISITTKLGMHNMSQEAYDQMCQNQSKGQIKRFSNPIEREKQRQIQLKRYEDPEEHVKTSISIKLAHLRDPNIRIKQSLAQKKRFEDPNEREKQRQAQLKRFEDPEEHVKTSEAIRLAFAKSSYEDIVKQELEKINVFNNLPQFVVEKFDSKTEKIFYWFMKNKHIQIRYQWYNSIEYPDFHKLFPINKSTGGKYVSPFHRWDFLIYTYKTPILVDLDGSIHNIQNPCLKKDTVEFNDSKRIYQTDNLPAYIIQCYKGFIDEFTKVIDINNPNLELKVLDLLDIIYEYNDPKYLDEE